MSHFLGLSARQLGYAKSIVATTKSYVEGTLHKPQDYAERAADIALAVVMVESDLAVYANHSVPGSLQLPHDAVGSDHHSVGLYQQQVPMWGTVASCQGVESSTVNFLHRLFQLDWPGRTNGELAQAVQVSDYPDRYAQRDLAAIRIRKAIW